MSTMEVSSRSPRRRRAKKARPSLWRVIVEQRMARIGLVILAVTLVPVTLAPFLGLADPVLQVAGAELQPPSPAHWFGTDHFGRDIFSRVLHGGSTSLVVGFAAVLVGVLGGAVLGVFSGYLGGKIDAVVMRLADLLLAFPAVLIGLTVAAIRGPGISNVAIGVGIVTVPIFARLARAAVLGVRSREYVLAARLLGSPVRTIIGRHILPSVYPALLVQMGIAMAAAVLLEAALSFLGLGAQPPDPSWGNMLSEARGFIRQAPWFAVFPGVYLAVTLLGINLVGDAMRDALNPRNP